MAQRSTKKSRNKKVGHTQQKVEMTSALEILYCAIHKVDYGVYPGTFQRNNRCHSVDVSNNISFSPSFACKQFYNLWAPMQNMLLWCPCIVSTVGVRYDIWLHSTYIVLCPKQFVRVLVHFVHISRKLWDMDYRSTLITFRTWKNKTSYEDKYLCIRGDITSEC